MLPTKTPQESMIWADKLQAAGNVTEAETIYRQIVAAQEDYHPAWHALGILAWDHNQVEVAIDLITHAIGLDPAMGIYQRNIGEMYRRLGRLDEAEKAGNHAVKSMPEDIDAHYNLGLVYTDQQQYSKAIKCYQRAIKLDDQHGLSWNNVGSALERQGDMLAAEAAYAKAVDIDSQHAEAQNNLGAIYSEQGKLDDATTCFEAAIASQPDFISAHNNLSSLKTYQPNDPHLTMLELINEGQANHDADNNIRLYFALGKAREDIGQYDRAFAAYQKGNQLQHELLPMDESQADQFLQEIKALFTREFFSAHLPPGSHQDKKPVFIVGMPRSGTTLIEQILSSHPEIHGAGELMTLDKVISNLPGKQNDNNYIQAASKLSADEFLSLGQAYVDEVWRLAPDNTVISDKIPGNLLYIGMIHLMFPNATIIHSMRDPMDSCFSCYARLFNDTIEFAYDLGTLGRYYVNYIELMKHWHNVLPKGRILDVHYEDVVEDLEGQARRMLKQVGLPWHAACLDFHKNKRDVKTASVAQVRKPIYKSSVARWQRFGSNLDPLLEIVKDYRE